MKRLSLIIALALCVTIGSVYATWVYNEHNDVADISGARTITLTEATFEGGLGTYTVTAAGLQLKVDPKVGTTHTTSLQASGEIIVTFTPSQYASEEVKENAVLSTFAFSSSVDVANWKHGEQQIFTSVDSTKWDIDWTGTKQADGTFKYSIPASKVAECLILNEINLDTKSDYDAYTDSLKVGQINISISDGITSTSNP
ncbi:MAG: hypothetical protein IJN15_00205 [Clostridia bacterium]|nr:hypothetical protein [Clostridia bacterium]